MDFYKQDAITSILHLHLDPDTEYIVHKAVLVGLMLGLASSTLIRIGQSVSAQGFQSSLRKPGHHLTMDVLLIKNKAQKHRS